MSGKRKQTRDTLQLKGDGPAFLQIIGSGAPGAPKALYFFSDSTRYIFNVGEGTQRLAHEYSIRIAQLDHIFITNPIWENIGGLLGLVLTLQESRVPEVTLHGPDGIGNLFELARGFVHLNSLKIKVARCGKDIIYSDPVVTINYVPLESNDVVLEHVCVQGSKESIENTCFNVDNQKNECLSEIKQTLENVFSNQTELLCRKSMAYICQLKPLVGKLNMSACTIRNVPPGPLLGKLKLGKDVTLPDGTVVKAADVKDPDKPGPIFIIIDCADESFFESLESESSFKKYQNVSNEFDIPKYVVHFSPSSVIENDRYQAWMNSFPKTTAHVYINDYNKCLGSVGCHDMQYKLNILDEKIFPILDLGGAPFILSSENNVTNNEFNRGDISHNLHDHQDYTGYTLRCLPLRKTTECRSNMRRNMCQNPIAFVEEITNRKEFSDEMEKLKLSLEKLPKNQIPNTFPRITFLGTGSCIPNTHRNVSGILVSLKKENNLILDCGEGTYGQIVRHYGYQCSQEILARINIIFISHMHADHHLGLINLLKRRRKAIQDLSISAPPLIVTAPHFMFSWLKNYDCIFEKILTDVEVISNDVINFQNKLEHYHQKILSVSPLKDFTTASVIHCSHSFGISFTDFNDIKITYSGDTMPSENLIQIGRNSTLLIHEATLEDEEEAEAKLHSTFKDAISVGKKMEAGFTLLTHFSQRYAKIPLIDEHFNEKVGVAFDNMEITMDDLPKLPLFNNMYNEFIFPEEVKLMQERQLKKCKISDSSIDVPENVQLKPER